MDLEFKESGRTYKEKIILDDSADTTEYKLPASGDGEGNSILVDHKSVSPSSMKKLLRW